MALNLPLNRMILNAISMQDYRGHVPREYPPEEAYSCCLMHAISSDKSGTEYYQICAL
jgi:hypothetical protein